MTIEIINVGTELLLGEIVNTNATALQKFCRERGFNVYHQTVVGDNPARFKACLALAFERGADCVITTGGLGPTEDDLTKELSAEYLGLPMELIPAEAEKVEQKCRFVSGYDKVPENNFKQAQFPKDAYILENDVGTANGCVMQAGRRMIANLPGPPKELNYLLEHGLADFFAPYKTDTIFTRDILTVGLGESSMEMTLKELIHAQGEVTVALYASEISVRVRLACKAKDQAEAEAKMQPAAEEIERLVGQYIIPADNLTEALRAILPPFAVEYRSDFRFRSHYPLANPNGDILRITVDTEPHPIGERLLLTFAMDGKTDRLAVPLLKRADLHHPRLEARITNRLYAFLKGR
ncbi:MAG: damage-inducible protein CinA [Clostridia bacterium]|nr:damage-inducible protein CinA [Clostridia bacterium]